jgi:hypothetical protein
MAAGSRTRETWPTLGQTVPGPRDLRPQPRNRRQGNVSQLLENWLELNDHGPQYPGDLVSQPLENSLLTSTVRSNPRFTISSTPTRSLFRTRETAEHRVQTDTDFAKVRRDRSSADCSDIYQEMMEYSLLP